MLKIEDNVDLKELEKFGFKKFRTIWNSDPNMPYETIWYYDLEFTNIDKKVTIPLLKINESNRIVEECIDIKYEGYCIVHETRLNVLYDLIKADIVEKVEEVEV